MWAVSGKCFNCTTLGSIVFDGSTTIGLTAAWRVDREHTYSTHWTHRQVSPQHLLPSLAPFTREPRPIPR